MKKVLLIGALALIFGSTDICAQGWLKKLGEKANKAKEAIEKVGNSALVKSGKESDNSVISKASNGLDIINNEMGYAQSEFFTPMPKPEIAEVADIKPNKLEIPEKFTPGESLPDGLTHYRILNDLLANMPSKDSIAAYWADSTGYYVKGAQCVRNFRDELIKLKDEMSAKMEEDMAQIQNLSMERMTDMLSGGYMSRINASLNQAGAALQQLEDNKDLIEAGFYNMTKLGEYYGVDPTTEEGAKTIDKKFNSLSEEEQLALCEKIGIKTVHPRPFENKEETTDNNPTGLTDEEMQILSSPVDPFATFGIDATLPSNVGDLYQDELMLQKRAEEFKAIYGQMLYDANKAVEGQYKEVKYEYYEFVGDIKVAHEQKRKLSQARYEFFKNTIVPESYNKVLELWAKTNESIPSAVLSIRRQIVSAKFANATSNRSQDLDFWMKSETDKGIMLIAEILDFLESAPTDFIKGFWLNPSFFDKEDYGKLYMGGVG